MTDDALHLKVRGVALWIKTLPVKDLGRLAVDEAFETLLLAATALARESLVDLFAEAWRIIDKDGRDTAKVWTEDQAIAEQAWQDEHNARWSPHKIVKPEGT